MYNFNVYNKMTPFAILLILAILFQSSFGQQCNNTPIADSADWPPEVNFEQSGFQVKDILHLVIATTNVNTRSDPVFTMNGISDISSPCNNWTKVAVTNSCLTNFELDLAWNNAKTLCKWNQTTEGTGAATKDVYTAIITLTSTETVYDVRGAATQREVQSQFTLQVTFPKYASISTNIDVFSKILVGAVIIQKGYNTIPALPNKGIVEFQTTIQFPFTLTLTGTGNPMDESPEGLQTQLLGPIANSPATQTGSLTFQRWRIVVDPSQSNRCTLDGLYKALEGRYVVSCLPNVSNCPTPTDGISFTFQVKSENFCARVAVAVSVTPSITSYNDANLTLVSKNFLISTVNPQRAYFKVSASSSAVSVQSVTITGVRLSSSELGGSERVLWQDTLQDAGIPFQIIVNQDNFNLLITNSFNVAQDQVSTVSVIVEMSIQYTGNVKKRHVVRIPSNSFGKRNTLELLDSAQAPGGSISKDIQTTFGITGGDASTTSSSSSSLVINGMSLVLLAFLGLMVGLN